MDEFVDRFRAITAEQVQQVAQKYLIDDRLTVAVLDPQPINKKAIAGTHGGAQNAH